MDSVDAILDEYLGKVPANFTYEGKTYTPKTFAKEVVGINPEDYVEFLLTKIILITRNL
jgi:bleomycin hydrolase